MTKALLHRFIRSVVKVQMQVRQRTRVEYSAMVLYHLGSDKSLCQLSIMENAKLCSVVILQEWRVSF